MGILITAQWTTCFITCYAVKHIAFLVFYFIKLSCAGTLDSQTATVTNSAVADVSSSFTCLLLLLSTLINKAYLGSMDVVDWSTKEGMCWTSGDLDRYALCRFSGPALQYTAQNSLI